MVKVTIKKTTKRDLVFDYFLNKEHKNYNWAVIVVVSTSSAAAHLKEELIV